MKDRETQEPRGLTLRSIQEPDEPFILTPPLGVIGGRPLDFPPFQPPPPGNLQLSLQAGKILGCGRNRRVMEVDVLDGESSPELSTMLLPPLAIKISRPWDEASIVKEAFFYEGMTCLQGSVVPRYYGVYEATVPGNCIFGLWDADMLKKEEKRQKRILKQNKSCPPLPPPTMVRILLLERVGEIISSWKLLSPATAYVPKVASRPLIHTDSIPIPGRSYPTCMLILLALVSAGATSAITISFGHLHLIPALSLRSLLHSHYASTIGG